MDQTVESFSLFVFCVQRFFHTEPDVGDGLDTLRNYRVILGVWNQVCLGLYLVEGPRLDGEVLAALHFLGFVPRPALPGPIDRIIMFLIFLIFILFGRDACLRQIEVMLAIVTSHREGFCLLVQCFIPEKLR